MKTNIRAIFSHHPNANLYNARYGIRVVTRYDDSRYWIITFKSRNGEYVEWKAYNLNELACLYSDAIYIRQRAETH